MGVGLILAVKVMKQIWSLFKRGISVYNNNYSDNYLM